MPVPPRAQEGRTGGAACPQEGQGLLPPPGLHGAQWGPSASPQLGGRGQAAPAAPVQSLRGTGAPVRASGHRAAPCGTALRHGLWGRGHHPATGSGCPGPPSCSGQGWPGGLMAVPPAAPLTSSRLFPSLLCTRHAPCEPFLRGIRTKGSWEYLSGTGETGGLLGGPSCPRPGQHQPGIAAVAPPPWASQAWALPPWLFPSWSFLPWAPWDSVPWASPPSHRHRGHPCSGHCTATTSIVTVGIVPMVSPPRAALSRPGGSPGDPVGLGLPQRHPVPGHQALPVPRSRKGSPGSVPCPRLAPRRALAAPHAPPRHGWVPTASLSTKGTRGSTCPLSRRAQAPCCHPAVPAS